MHIITQWNRTETNVGLKRRHIRVYNVNKIILISVYIQRTKCFYCVVLYSVSFGRPSYFFLLLCLYFYC